jgi:hypothetical protein
MAEKLGIPVEDLTFDKDAPSRVKFAPRFEADVLALALLLSGDHPVKRVWRCWRIFLVVYGFGDASGKAYGASWTGSDGIHIRIGVWGPDEESGTSNWKELSNSVDSLQVAAEAGDLKDAEVFFCTDNSTAEAAIYSGTSSSVRLYEQVLRLRKLECDFGFVLHVSHVAGTRMIAQGTDGLSRGNLEEGVLAGEDILSFIPWHRGAIERHPPLATWMASWLPEDHTVLTPEDWFELGHDIRSWKPGPGGLSHPVTLKGTWVWAPPPAAADVAIEELRKARHKRQASTHIFVCPCLMTPRWMKALYKASDVVLRFPVGPAPWPNEMHEALLIGIVLPFIPCRPWQLRFSPKILAMGRTVQSLWKEGDGRPEPVLRELLGLPGRLSHMQGSLVWKVLQSGYRGELLGKQSGGRRGPPVEETEG